MIDIDVVVREAEDMPAAIERLGALDYVHQGDLGIPGREAFLAPPGVPAHHLYVVVANSRSHLDHLRFRDHLRRNPAAARKYATLKTQLAERHRVDRVGYAEAKSAFIAAALRDAYGS